MEMRDFLGDDQERAVLEQKQKTMDRIAKHKINTKHHMPCMQFCHDIGMHYLRDGKDKAVVEQSRSWKEISQLPLLLLHQSLGEQ